VGGCEAGTPVSVEPTLKYHPGYALVLTLIPVKLSDPVVPNGRAIAHQTKGTLGITGLSLPSVHSGGAVWHLDVGSSHPGGGEAPKGLAVRQ